MEQLQGGGEPRTQIDVVEICVCSVDGAAAALAGGATAIELCSDLCEGGITPSYGLIKLCRERFPRPGRLIVLIRPRGGDFLYSNSELAVMYEDIKMAGTLGADGVAFGCLTAAGEIDMDTCVKLFNVATTHGLESTFHRAFDMCKDLSASLTQLAAIGIKRVLTSGGMPSAIAGAGSVAKLVGEADRGVRVVAAGNITSENVGELVGRTGVLEVHSSARRNIISKMRHRNPNVSFCGTSPSDYLWPGTDATNVAQLRLQHSAAVAKLPPARDVGVLLKG